MSNKAEWLIWDIDESAWWKDAGGGNFDHADSRDEAARLTLAEAREIVDAINDPANDPTAAMVPA